jgi:hypothetical protein
LVLADFWAFFIRVRITVQVAFGISFLGLPIDGKIRSFEGVVKGMLEDLVDFVGSIDFRSLEVGKGSCFEGTFRTIGAFAVVEF